MCVRVCVSPMGVIKLQEPGYPVSTLPLDMTPPVSTKAGMVMCEVQLIRANATSMTLSVVQFLL